MGKPRNKSLTVHAERDRIGVVVDFSTDKPIDRYAMFETISYLYWKIYKFYKTKDRTQWESGKIAKRVCIKRFGYENYQAWKNRFQDEHYSQIYSALRAKGYDRKL